MLNHSGRWMGFPFDRWSCCQTNLEKCPTSIRVVRGPGSNQTPQRPSSSNKKVRKAQTLSARSEVRTFSNSIAAAMASTFPQTASKPQQVEKPTRDAAALRASSTSRPSAPADFAVRISSPASFKRTENKQSPSKMDSAKSKATPPRDRPRSAQPYGGDKLDTASVNSNKKTPAPKPAPKPAVSTKQIDAGSNTTASSNTTSQARRSEAVSAATEPDTYQQLSRLLIQMKEESDQNLAKVNRNLAKLEDEQRTAHSKLSETVKRLNEVDERLDERISPLPFPADVKVESKGTRKRTTVQLNDESRRPARKVATSRTDQRTAASENGDERSEIKYKNAAAELTFEDRLRISVNKFHTSKGYHKGDVPPQVKQQKSRSLPVVEGSKARFTIRRQSDTDELSTLFGDHGEYSNAELSNASTEYSAHLAAPSISVAAVDLVPPARTKGTAKPSSTPAPQPPPISSASLAPRRSLSPGHALSGGGFCVVGANDVADASTEAWIASIKLKKQQAIDRGYHGV
jgi:hypothetical protein